MEGAFRIVIEWKGQAHFEGAVLCMIEFFGVRRRREKEFGGGRVSAEFQAAHLVHFLGGRLHVMQILGRRVRLQSGAHFRGVP